jgi:hypothetical protein
MGRLINVLFVLIIVLSDSPKNPAGDAAFQIRPITERPRPFEPDTTRSLRNAGCTELSEFIGQG